MSRTMVVSSCRQRAARHALAGALVVATPLDAIVRLEAPHPIDTVVLVGSYAADRDLAAFLAEVYPAIQLQREL
jgi:hypothetical protein